MMRADELGIHPMSRRPSANLQGNPELLSLSPEEIDRHAAAQGVDLDASAAGYTRGRVARTPEAIAEELARGAHGSGVEMMNPLTGDHVITRISPHTIVPNIRWAR
jgi:hypothetical protein